MMIIWKMVLMRMMMEVIRIMMMIIMMMTMMMKMGMVQSRKVNTLGSGLGPLQFDITLRMAMLQAHFPAFRSFPRGLGRALETS